MYSELNLKSGQGKAITTMTDLIKYYYIMCKIFFFFLASNEASEMQSPQQLTFLKSRLVLPVTTYSKSTTRHITIVNNGLPTSQPGIYRYIIINIMV